MAKHPKFELFKGKNNETYFRLTASNGETILSSEGYKAKSGAENGIESVKKNCGDQSRFELKSSSNGKFYFNLTAANGQVIGTSQMYRYKAGRDIGVESVQKHAPKAEIEEID